MSFRTNMAAGGRLKTSRRNARAGAGETFEPMPVLMGTTPSGLPGSARGARLAIDVPRTLAATPCGWSLATTAVERGRQGLRSPRRPAPAGKETR